jgi:hypothetical protein
MLAAMEALLHGDERIESGIRFEQGVPAASYVAECQTAAVGRRFGRQLAADRSQICQMLVTKCGIRESK